MLKIRGFHYSPINERLFILLIKIFEYDISVMQFLKAKKMRDFALSASCLMGLINNINWNMKKFLCNRTGTIILALLYLLTCCIDKVPCDINSTNKIFIFSLFLKQANLTLVLNI